MVGELFINNEDARKTYGIIFGEDSLTALMTPPPVKPYIENKSALVHGKQVLNDEDNPPKLDERDVQLTFYLHAKNREQFLERYQKFTTMLQKGKVDIRTKYQPGTTYHCLYISCAQFSQFNGRLAKFVLKLNEPNPKDRGKND
ncbi:MAG: hypothetical protein HFJ95_01600 [Muribaculaceae bacterium]|nr:hypothetical protein [Muribaculaceae bacterium]